MESIADRLDSLMRRHGVRGQSQLARECGVGQSTINRILKKGDEYSPSWQTLRRLSNYFNVSILWLAEGTGDDRPQTSLATAILLRESDVAGETELSDAVERLRRLEPSARGTVLALLRLLTQPGQRVG
ncbi:MAG: helix-turn-helix domain-containing protein [Pigmentiphaga sp.]